MKQETLEKSTDIQMGYQSRKMIVGSDAARFAIIMGKDVTHDSEIETGYLTRFEPEGDIERYLVKTGDVLFMAKGSYNYAACIKAVIDNTLASGSFYILRVKDPGLHPCYLAWWLNQSAAQDYFHQTQSSGATISFISAEALRKTPVTIPEMDIQLKIIALHDSYRSWKNKQIELLEAQQKMINHISLNAIKPREHK